MRRLAVFAAVTTTLMATTSALAQQGTGFYVGAGAGINLLQDNNLNIDNYDVGPAGNIYGGYDWGSLRADLEVSIRENSHDGDNHQTTLGIMVNGYYDFEFGSPFVPYIGGGVGLGVISADFRGRNDRFFQDTQTAFAYAGIAGVSYNFSPALAASLEYRYSAPPGRPSRTRASARPRTATTTTASWPACATPSFPRRRRRRRSRRSPRPAAISCSSTSTARG